MNNYYSVKQVAEKLAVNHKLIRKEVQGGKLAAYKVGGVIRIAETDLNNYLEDIKIKKPPPCKATANKPKQNRKKLGGFKFL